MGCLSLSVKALPSSLSASIEKRCGSDVKVSRVGSTPDVSLYVKTGKPAVKCSKKNNLTINAALVCTVSLNTHMYLSVSDGLLVVTNGYLKVM